MQGRRLYVYESDPLSPQPGDYWYNDRGECWMCRVPNGLYGNLKAHHIDEHEDGTITVSPSILISSARGDLVEWHGYLERGVWREV